MSVSRYKRYVPESDSLAIVARYRSESWKQSNQPISRWAASAACFFVFKLKGWNRPVCCSPNATTCAVPLCRFCCRMTQKRRRSQKTCRTYRPQHLKTLRRQPPRKSLCQRRRRCASEYPWHWNGIEVAAVLSSAAASTQMFPWCLMVGMRSNQRKDANTCRASHVCRASVEMIFWNVPESVDLGKTVHDESINLNYRWDITARRAIDPRRMPLLLCVCDLSLWPLQVYADHGWSILSLSFEAARHHAGSLGDRYFFSLLKGCPRTSVANYKSSAEAVASHTGDCNLNPRSSNSGFKHLSHPAWVHPKLLNQLMPSVLKCWSVKHIFFHFA